MKQEAPRLLSALLDVVSAFLISELFNILKRLAGFYVRVWLFDPLSRLLQIQKGHPTILLLLWAVRKPPMSQARGRAGKVFRTCHVVVDGAPVARSL